MRKIIYIISILLVSASVIFAQSIIENPEEPLSKNAGRVLKLQEVLRITDESGKFFSRVHHLLKSLPMVTFTYQMKINS